MDFVSVNRLRRQRAVLMAFLRIEFFLCFRRYLKLARKNFHRSLQVLLHHVDDNAVKSLAPLPSLSDALLVIATRLIGIRSNNAFMDAILNSPELFLPLRKSIYVLQLQVER